MNLLLRTAFVEDALGLRGVTFSSHLTRASYVRFVDSTIPPDAFDAPAEHPGARWARVVRRWAGKHAGGARP